MSELLSLFFRGLIVLLGHLVAALDVYEWWAGRRRRRRLAALARGERVEIPCVLRDPVLTDGRYQEGRLAVGSMEVAWHANRQAQPAAAFAPGPLTMEAVDAKAITFRSEDGRTELRLHPDEAQHVLRALGSPQNP